MVKETRMGRPKKGRRRRIPITVHVQMDILDAIDYYVEGQAQQREGQYSRSDFWNEAATAYMEQIGISLEDKEK